MFVDFYHLSAMTEGEALQYLSSQNEYINEHNASQGTPVGPGQNSSIHNSQQLLRLPVQCPDSLAYLQRPLVCTGNTDICYSHSGVTNQTYSSLVEIMPKNYASLYTVSEKEKVCIPEYLKTFCFSCRNPVMGKKILQHLLFGYMKCNRCDLNIRSCKELKEIDEKKHQCKNGFEKIHDFSFLNPDIFHFLSFQIWQYSRDRAKGPPLSNNNLLKIIIYLRNLRPLFNVEPWSSVLRKCQQYIRNSSSLPLREICSDSSIENAIRKSVSEEDMDVALKLNNLSRHLIESDINMHRKVDIGTISCSPKGKTKASNVKGNSKSSCSIVASVVEESSRGTADFEVRPSVVLGVSKCLVRSKSSSISSFNIATGSKDVINAQICSTSTPNRKEDPKCSLNPSVRADNRFGERKLKIPILPDGRRILEAETNEEMNAKVSDGKTFERENIFEAQEKTNIRSGVENRDWEILEANLVKDSWVTTSLRPIKEFVTDNNMSSVMGWDSHSRKCSSDEELLSRNEKNENSDFQKKCNVLIVDLGESDSDTNSVSENLYGRSNYSKDSENLEVMRNQSCPIDLPTLTDLSPLSEPNNLYCEEKQLLINFQTVETTGLANVKCPEECPMCYTVLCPSRFHVNLKTFHLTSHCLGCGIFITITLGESEKPSNWKRIYKRPGPKSRTNPLASKKQKNSD